MTSAPAWISYTALAISAYAAVASTIFAVRANRNSAGPCRASAQLHYVVSRPNKGDHSKKNQQLLLSITNPRLSEIDVDFIGIPFDARLEGEPLPFRLKGRSTATWLTVLSPIIERDPNWRVHVTYGDGRKQEVPVYAVIDLRTYSFGESTKD